MLTKDFRSKEMLKFQPLDDRVLLKPLLDPSRGVIVLTDEKPENDIDSPSGKLAEVIAVGPGKRRKNGTRQALKIQPGQKVWYGRFVDWSAYGFVIVQEADIVGVAAGVAV